VRSIASTIPEADRSSQAEAAGGDLPGAVILVAGTRGAAVAAERGIKPAWATPMTTHVEGIAAFANRLAEALYRFVAQGTIATADILLSLGSGRASHRSAFAVAARPRTVYAPDREGTSAD
jgi:hypothetical protein